MKKSKILKTAVLSVFFVAVMATGTFAGTLSECLSGEGGSKFPNLKAVQLGGEAEGGDDADAFPVKCSATFTEGDGEEKTHYTIYAKKSSDCSQAASVAVDPDKCDSGDLNSFITLIINAVLFIIGIVAVVMIVLGGIGYATSQGDPGKVKKGKDTILYGIIGLVVALLAFAIVNFVLGAING